MSGVKRRRIVLRLRVRVGKSGGWDGVLRLVAKCRYATTSAEPKAGEVKINGRVSEPNLCDMGAICANLWWCA